MALAAVILYFLLLIFVSGATSTAMASGETESFVSIPAMEAATVIPDWVDAYGAARISTRLFYGHGGLVLNGRRYPTNHTQVRPSVELSEAHPNQHNLYTLVMVDPDAVSPTSPIYRNFLHWLVINIPPSTKKPHDIWTTGTEVVKYVGPAPPMGLHRYYVLVFKQRQSINVKPIEDRKLFDVRKFTEQYGLGYPVGGMFFTAQAGM